MIAYPFRPLLALALVTATAALLTWLLIVLIRPMLARHALARPNARSSHREPTPQGGGLAVIAAVLAAVWGAIVLGQPMFGNLAGQFYAATAAAMLLAAIGGLDDIRSLSAAVRLAAQALAVGLVIATLPNEVRAIPHVPHWLDRTVLFLGGIWFVNLFNFMDGIDWMTVAEVVPITGAVVLLALFAGIGILPTLVAGALFGAMLGFAPFNKPVARLFLGDVGSLPLGLLVGWLLLQVASRGHLTAAILLPLYYLADATITLGRRLARGERVWEAHRSHFYQRALDLGFTVPQVIARVAAVNIALVLLALITASTPTLPVKAVSLAAGCALVAWLLISFARGKNG
jgi:UDP-N-acetylmuramyl pentapeptide phosphotransferase/UDP-N-acetylglucosamine-1-phosphate transferase